MVDGISMLSDVPPDVVQEHAVLAAKQLDDLGWRKNAKLGGTFGGYQPSHVFEIPLAGRSMPEVFSGFNASWRRNVRKAARAGVDVAEGDATDLKVFHRLLMLTGERDGFAHRPLDYYRRQFAVLNQEEPGRMRLYLAKHAGEVLAAATLLQVGQHVWFQSGASANHRREVRPSNAIQWKMIQDAHARGATVYDMRGISDALGPRNPLLGLTRFKIGAGGQAVENLGEWDLDLNKPLGRAVEFYLSLRSARNAGSGR
jgi:lipid II:glycine glycyltransferase (peptidoglycan interpeptide bridge formation enzyme)